MAESYTAAPETTRPQRDPFARVAKTTPKVDPADPLGDAAVAQGPVGAVDPITGAPTDAAQDPTVYLPTPDDAQLTAEIDRKFQEYRQDRQPHEAQWFLGAAFFRGKHNVNYNTFENRLVAAPSVNPERSRRQINRIFAKVRSRRAKFLKNRPTWVVVPATSDIKDKMDARTTGKVLDYLWRKLKLEEKFRDAIIWAETCSRGYWWFGWDAQALGRVQMAADPAAGTEKTIQEGQVGEVTVEVGSTFEVVVSDPGATSLSTAEEIIRAKERTLDYCVARFPNGKFVKAEPAGDIFQFERQIANLNNQTDNMFGGSTGDLTSRKRDLKGNPNSVVVKEYFCRPNSTWPKGRYCVVAGGILLKQEDLPFGFHDLANPFPCVEFVDIPSAGQYWGPTMIDQLIDIQREYNGIRTMISKQLRKMGHPKIFVAKQHQLADGAWTDEAGEIVEYVARPNIKEPFVIEPANIIADAWRTIELLRSEFDDITQIFPAAEGKSTGTESGFHANLLQEASDLVHGPDIRAHELAIEEAAIKIRRIIKQGYDIPRLITITSASAQPEVVEFSSEDVDDYADIVVQAGSALPMLKGARIQAALDMYAKGVLGDPMDPEVRRRLLNVLDLGGMDDIYDYNRVDEDMINIENSNAEDGTPLSEPRFYENHQAHWTGHINKLKSPAVMTWQSPQRMGLLAHAILHAMYINHAAAYQMSIEAGLAGLIPPPPMMGLPPGMGGAPGAAGGPGGPPGATPPGQATAAAPQPGHGFNEAPDQTAAAGSPAAS